MLATFGLYPASRTIERGKKMSRVIIDETKHPRPAIICRKSTANLDKRCVRVKALGTNRMARMAKMRIGEDVQVTVDRVISPNDSIQRNNEKRDGE